MNAKRTGTDGDAGGPPTLENVGALLRAEYDLSGDLHRLPGENNNYHVEIADGRLFVLKISAPGATVADIELEDLALRRAKDAGLGLDLPLLVPTRQGALETAYPQADGPPLRARLLEFVRGTPWREAGRHPVGLLRELGGKLAALDLAYSGLTHPAAERSHRWDLARAAAHRVKIGLIEDLDRRQLIDWAFQLYAACAESQLPALPHSLIHGDANDENVLVQDGHVSGLLDFGDCLNNPTICELAIAVAYVMLNHEVPLEAGAEVVTGYHAVRPVSREEMNVLFPLVCGRLAVSVAVAAERRRRDPGHPTWFVTEPGAWRLLKGLSTMDPATAAALLGSRIGYPPEITGGSVEKLLRRRHRHLSPSLSIAYQSPLKIVRGRGQFLYDERGRPFLDMVNNVCHVGHCHPRVVTAGQEQMAVLNTNTRYLYDGLTEYAERLCATLPEPLDTCFFVNSGSEANELALRIAMTCTGRRDFLVAEGAYHGHTARLVALSPYKFMGRGGPGRPEPWVHVVPLPDGYRGLYKGQQREAGIAYGEHVGQTIHQAAAPIAGLMIEPLLSCGGQIIPPDGYLETAFRHVRSAGGLCIADEVQVGFGRAGSHFWAFETQGVVPDIVVMGKPIGNGHPMAAVVTTRQIAEAFATGMEFFSTFGGNPVSCAIGLAVLDVIQDEDLQQHAQLVGNRLLAGFRGLTDRHPLIGDVRGAGLFIGVELVRDRQSLEPAAREAAELVERMKARGILLSTDGPLHNVIKIKPPMVLTADDADMVVRSFDHALYQMRP